MTPDRDATTSTTPPPVALHTPPTIFSIRHAPSWMLLAFAAGSVNAGALLACQRFVSHVTGTATRIGVDVGLWTLMGEYALVLGCFIAGAMASVLALDGRHRRGKRPLYHAPLVVVAALVAGVAVAGRAGAFGAFGASVEGPADFALLSILSFAMGLQNAAVATTTGLAIRTTHMTGPATDLGVHLATAVYAEGDARRAALRGAMLRGGKLAAFVLGGVAMVPLARAAGHGAFFLPAAVILVATALSFVPAWWPRRAPSAVPAHAA